MALQKHLVEGAMEVLDYLKSKNYRLFIITNGFKEVQHNKLYNTGLNTYFEKVFISEEVKTPKPGREIFEYAIKSANAKKKSSLMIGDDWDVDILGAINFGLDAVYYNKKCSFQKGIEKKSKVFYISRIAELQQIL